MLLLMASPVQSQGGSVGVQGKPTQPSGGVVNQACLVVYLFIVCVYVYLHIHAYVEVKRQLVGACFLLPTMRILRDCTQATRRGNK